MPAANQETKCYSSGSQEPEINANNLTVYSMRFCPYAERVRLLLEYKNLSYDVINIDLAAKPSWFLERNPLGKVPTIKEPGVEPLFESLICAEYLDEKYPGKKALPSDLHEKARQKMQIEVITQKFFTPFHNVRLKGGAEANAALLKGMDEVEKMLTGKYFAGEKIGFVDLMVWPWFERLPALIEVRKVDIPEELYPKITAWRKAMLSEPAVKTITYPHDIFVQVWQRVVEGKTYYDVGL